MNKKGYEFFEIPMWLIRMFYAIIVMVTVIFIVSYFIVLEVNVERVESYVAAGMLYYSPPAGAGTLFPSPGGLAYYDVELERVLPGVVDVSYLTPELQGIKLGNANIIGARVNVSDKTTSTDKIAVLNPDVFERLNWLAEAGLTSEKGGPDKVVLYHKVLLIDGASSASNTMKIEAVTIDS
ncbi:MAG: hypothetical protein V1702_05865 [Candidatus Woesearchaeota archaeon]